MQIVPIYSTAQDLTDILPGVPSQDFLEEELFRPQFPGIWVINRCVDIVRCERDVRVTWLRGPCVECERNFQRQFLHVLANPSLCNVRASKYLSTEGFAAWNIVIGK